MSKKVEMQKWEAKVSAKLSNASVDQIWPFFTDFFNFHNWFPSLSTCHGVHGNNGEPGCIRYCSGFSIPASNGRDAPVSWSKERLVAVDHVDRVLTYEIVESNIGFESYVSTVRIVRDDASSQRGCVIEWSFAVDPVEGLVFDDLVRKYDLGLQRTARRMEDSLFDHFKKLEGLWEGRVTAKLGGLTPDQVWPLVEDFFGLHKWHPKIDTCHQVEGQEKETIRYCASTVAAAESGEITAVMWAKERLIERDPIGRLVRYEVQENNVGFNHWIATIKVSEDVEGQNGNFGCEIEWSFVGEPVQGWSYDDVLSYYEFSLQSIADKMQHYLLSPTLLEVKS